MRLYKHCATQKIASFTESDPSTRRALMPEITFLVNGKSTVVEVSGDTPLLWVLRDTLNLTGTKYGCGIAQCGACQSGQIMTAAGFLKSNQHPTPDDVDKAMSNNICRCGTAQRIRAAILR